MQVNSKKVAIFLVAIVILFTMTACTNNLQPPPPKPMTQLEWRELSTRYFDSNDRIAVMKALVAALQDEGFIITSANTDLGLVTAKKEITEVDEEDKIFQEFWYGKASGYQRSKEIDVTATTTETKKGMKVRINLTAKGIADTGGILWAQPIDDPRPYQAIFGKLGKSLFLQKEQL